MNCNYKEIAKVCHEANRAYCLYMGDDSQKPWEEAPEWQRESCIEGVKHHLNNPELTPEDSHEAWCAKKRLEGWIFGEEKDEMERTHPCLVPFSELPLEQQAKDYIFAGIVRAMSA